ncbi:hypothetical protein EDC65_0322 [Stella humosa]|uniref:Uncharacterized protein n=1 Tax=Stella humosa TaxID=94 RepID=A0A3N1MDF9_9PROT|nr:hypothetical protein [Stella humosa]ROQ01145.1 hypothetical protein EDC65_0322 [Stella humosa]BBK31520.1 hypothetical protein STHU_21540 [Stella humosa]
MEKPTSLAGRGGLLETVELGSRDEFDDSTLDRRRATVLARRFALPMPVAALVAGLALGGAHG